MKRIKSSHIITLFAGVITTLLAIAIISFPDAAFKASLQGLKIWWEIIFPALLPFFITSEILLGFGVVHFMGELLEPLMKPLFNVPGVGAFVLAMGFSSGYPMGAKLTTRLREQKMVSQVEGERLVAFTSTSDPLFIFGAIAVGFFHQAELGIFLAIVHYASSLIVGFIMRFHEINNQQFSSRKFEMYKKEDNIFIRAFKAMHQARMADGRQFGKLMGDAVMSSIQTLLMIGGFIIAFSVVLSILTQIEVTSFLISLLHLILTPLGISQDLAQSMIYGFFEVTLGAKSVSEASMNIPLIEKLAIVSAISAWSGISVHGQIAAILQKTDIRFKPFFIARVFHSILAFILSLLLYQPFQLSETKNAIPTFLYHFSQEVSSFHLISIIHSIGYYFLWIITTLLLLSLTIHLLKKKDY
ncbi:sporulation integral membrane protein YlbJ [Tepidibacillus sp. LV47]|uniref:sporulation integral membrane protein YlbJ n=1 Tax=Tepidibacillus sp. LV47 TaxID=3398228 RepID=UPI003AAAFBB8